MRRRLVRLLLILIVAAATVAVWKHEEAERLWAVNTLFDAGKITANFSAMDTMFHTAALPRGDGPVSPLPAAATPMDMPAGFGTWIVDRSVTAVVVLKDGQIVHQSYYRGTTPEDLRISWSVAKSFLSALLGVVMEDGAIGSLDDPVVKYAPGLKGSAYDGATIRNVLNMASGVAFNEDYLDFWSDINKMGRALALGQSLDGFTAALRERRALPGTEWHYVSMDTHVIGMVIRGATGLTIPELMDEKIIQPLGLEAAPYYLTDAEGNAFVLGGLNLRTRDYARFGQMILQDGFWNGQQIVPAAWIAASTTPSAPTAPGARQYGLQWWMPADAQEGEFYAVGVYGQYIYFDRRRGVVIAVNSTDKGFTEQGVEDANLAMFRAIARAAQ